MAKKRHRGRRKSGNWFTRMSIGKKIAVTFGSLIICLAAASVVYVAAKWSKVEVNTIAKEDLVINKTVEEQLGTGYTNIALFGGDSRTGELGEGVRTDSIIIASLNNETKEIKMVSVYRDTLLDISGNDEYQKCNAAYSFGGPTGAINMLNRNLDLNIENYVTVDFAIIADVVDQLGGIEIEVIDAEIPYINKYIPETARVSKKKAKLVKKAGKQTLDGVQATTYARIRSTKGGDFKRTDRQRYVIEQMVKKIKTCNLATINKIMDSVLPKISTNMSATEIAKYAAFYNQYTLGENTGFPEVVSTATLDGKGSVVIPVSLEDNVVKMHEFLYPDDSYMPSSEVSDISNTIATITAGAVTGAANSNETYDAHENEGGDGSGENIDINPMSSNPTPTFAD